MLYSLLSWLTQQTSSDAAVMLPLRQVELTYAYHTQPVTKWRPRDLHAQSYKWAQLLYSHCLQNVVLEGLDTPFWLIYSFPTVRYDWAANTYLLYNVVLVSATQRSESSLWILYPLTLESPLVNSTPLDHPEALNWATCASYTVTLMEIQFLTINRCNTGA